MAIIATEGTSEGMSTRGWRCAFGIATAGVMCAGDLLASTVSMTLPNMVCAAPAGSGGHHLVCTAGIVQSSPPSGCQISPAAVSLRAGESQIFTVSCANILAGAWYSWTSDGSPTSGIGATYTATFSKTASVNVQVCNGPGACASTSRAVSVSASPPPPPGPVMCTNLIPGITKTTYLEHDLATGWLNIPYPGVPMLGDEALVIRLITPATAGTRLAGIQAGAALQSGESKSIILSTKPCAQWGEPGVQAQAWGAPGANFTYSVGTGSPPVLQTRAQYFLTITNQRYDSVARRFVLSCFGEECSTILQVQTP